MTRINVVPPNELHQKHLIAEYRELPRIFKQSRAAWVRGELPTDKRNPIAYTLGKGHVRFFYPRLLFLIKRQASLISEMIRRDYKPNFDAMTLASLVDDMPEEWKLDYEPTPEALAINRARISERTTWDIAA